MNPEQAERIASALETIASRLGQIQFTLDALATQSDMTGQHLASIADTITLIAARGNPRNL